jgi:hypothetical protein
MNREESLAIRQQWTGVLNAVNAAEGRILDQLEVLSGLAVSAQRGKDPIGFDLECSVDCIREQLESLDAQLAALLRGEARKPVVEGQESAVLVG